MIWLHLSVHVHSFINTEIEQNAAMWDEGEIGNDTGFLVRNASLPIYIIFGEHLSDIFAFVRTLNGLEKIPWYSLMTSVMSVVSILKLGIFPNISLTAHICESRLDEVCSPTATVASFHKHPGY